jgi:hypothetical protein
LSFITFRSGYDIVKGVKIIRRLDEYAQSLDTTDQAGSNDDFQTWVNDHPWSEGRIEKLETFIEQMVAKEDYYPLKYLSYIRYLLLKYDLLFHLHYIYSY